MIKKIVCDKIYSFKPSFHIAAYIVTEMSGTPVALDDLVVIDHTDRYEVSTTENA